MNQLAVDAGLRRATMYAWFSGKVSPEMESLSALATACKVHRWQILAAMDGYDFSAARRAVVAEEVEAAVAIARRRATSSGHNSRRNRSRRTQRSGSCGVTGSAMTVSLPAPTFASPGPLGRGDGVEPGRAGSRGTAGASAQR